MFTSFRSPLVALTITLTAALFLLAPLSAGEVLTPEKLWQLKRLGSVTVSPDGNHAVYSVTQYNWQDETSNSDLYVLDIARGESRRLTSHTASDHNPIFAADGAGVYFLSNREDKAKAQLYYIALNGGEAERISNAPDGLSNVKLLPGQERLLFTKEVALGKPVKNLFEDLPNASARVYDDLKLRHWDGWFEGTYSHLHLADINGDNARDLMKDLTQDTPTKPFGDAGDFTISPDGKEIAYVALVPNRPADSTDTGIYLLPTDGKVAELLTKNMGGYDVEPRYSPDGTYLAWLSMETPGYESDRNRIMLYHRKNKTIEELTVGLDETVSHIAWQDNDTLIFNGPTKGTYQLYRMDITRKGKKHTGNITQITKGRHNLSSFTVKGDLILAKKSTHERPFELVKVNADGSLKTLTDINGDHYAKLDLPEIETMWVDATDGKKIHNWIIKPPNFDPNKKYPLLVYCQGGPQSMVSQFFSFRWNFHLMAAQGYVVVGINRRGLPGFGREWNDSIKGDYGGQPMRDILSSTDAMLAKDYIETQRVAAIGASFGGYTVFRLMGMNHGENKRFQSMISHCGLFNMEGWYGATEELFFPNRDMGGPYWESEEQKKQYAENSPHSYVQNWETPILVIHGQLDYRVPLTEGLQAFQAAKMKGNKARFLYFPDEGHWVLKPQNGILWHRIFFQWLEETLPGTKEKPSAP
ncbi:S9 family peptidase [Acanthopleuribacter pedis]|uniref:S9 family peptidase n=1 Tax=Acanthopleuribacter pedis TaxID=442870 RepID=A0A8J7QGT4_9BACT|nr:S9 family peptidase [Acanthopleuribacter pedis]MBO1318368.1 S9 family peptidase [Acanthopleuribacter pedis]